MDVQSRFEVISVILGFIMVVLVIAGVAVVGYVIYYYVLSGLLAPTRRVTARLVWKYHQVRTMGGEASSGIVLAMLTGLFGPKFGSYSDCIIRFECDGKQHEFAVSAAVYNAVEVGDVGLLVHQGNLFREFIKHAGGWSDPVNAPTAPVRQ